MPKPPESRELALKAIGSAVLAKRRGKDWTQVELAKAASIDQAAVSRIERGDYRGITPALILQLAVALDCRASDLLGGLDSIVEIARWEAGQAAGAA